MDKFYSEDSEMEKARIESLKYEIERCKNQVSLNISMAKKIKEELAKNLEAISSIQKSLVDIQGLFEESDRQIRELEISKRVGGLVHKTIDQIQNNFDDNLKKYTDSDLNDSMFIMEDFLNKLNENGTFYDLMVKWGLNSGNPGRPSFSRANPNTPKPSLVNPGGWNSGSNISNIRMIEENRKSNMREDVDRKFLNIKRNFETCINRNGYEDDEEIDDNSERFTLLEDHYHKEKNFPQNLKENPKISRKTQPDEILLQVRQKFGDPKISKTYMERLFKRGHIKQVEVNEPGQIVSLREEPSKYVKFSFKVTSLIEFQEKILDLMKREIKDYAYIVNNRNKEIVFGGVAYEKVNILIGNLKNKDLARNYGVTQMKLCTYYFLEELIGEFLDNFNDTYVTNMNTITIDSIVSKRLVMDEMREFITSLRNHYKYSIPYK